MNDGEISQLYSFLIFIGIGILIVLIFDIFRIFRKTFKTSDLLTILEDIIFSIITGFILLFSIFKFNNGEMRLYVFLGLILGAIIYVLTISKTFVKINVIIINTIKKIITKIGKLALFPLKITFLFLRKLFLKPISFFFFNFKKRFTNFIEKFSRIIRKNTVKKGF